MLEFRQSNHYLTEKINTYMSKKTLPADKFFNSVDYVSIVNTIKGIYTSDGSMSVLIDFERVLDNADLYAYKNWIMGCLLYTSDAADD
jgi:hypothetical protein